MKRAKLVNAEKYEAQTQEHFETLQKMELYFKKNPKPEIPHEPQVPSTDKNNYKNMKITFPEDCITKEQRQSYRDASIGKAIAEVQKKYEKDCQQYPALKENYDQYVKNFSEAFPATEEEQKTFGDNQKRMEILNGVVNSEVYQKVKSLVNPQSLSAGEVDQGFEVESVIYILATEMRYDEKPNKGENALRMTEFMFPKIDAEIGKSFVECLHPGFGYYTDDFSYTAGEMIKNIAKQNSDNYQFLCDTYESMYWGGSCPFHGYTGKAAAGAILNQFTQKDDQGRIVQEMTGHGHTIAADNGVRPELKRYKYEKDCTKTECYSFRDVRKDGKDAEPDWFVEEYSDGRKFEYDSSKNLRIKKENNTVTEYDGKGNVEYHSTDGKDDTIVFLAKERLAKRRAEAMEKLEEQPAIVKKVANKIADSEIFNDIAMKWAVNQVKKNRK